ncbi:hypothetical protein N9F40_00420 [bacterium]|nr:hypothetical protein [bacterium]
MALRASVARLATSQGLSAPAGAPVFSATLPEAKARSRQFFRDVSCSIHTPFAARSASLVCVQYLREAEARSSRVTHIRRAHWTALSPLT